MLIITILFYDNLRERSFLKAFTDLRVLLVIMLCGSENSSVAAVVSCFCFIIVAAVIVLGLEAYFLLFILLYSQRVPSHSCETLEELLPS